MDLGLKNKNVLIVGASKGIGRSIALGFAGEGARVTTLARSESLLAVLNAQMKKQVETDHAYYTVDLMETDTGRLAKDLIEKRGAFDAVVHALGGSFTGRDPLAPLDQWLYAWKFNAGVAIDMNSVLIKPMIDKGWGRVIHISSISAVILRGNPLYASAKAYLNAYVTTVGRELADTGVVLSAVMPGAIAFEGSHWDEIAKTDPARCEDFFRCCQGVKRFGKPEEVSDVVLFLAGEQASFMQAAIVPVPGASM